MSQQSDMPNFQPKHSAESDEDEDVPLAAKLRKPAAESDEDEDVPLAAKLRKTMPPPSQGHAARGDEDDEHVPLAAKRRKTGDGSGRDARRGRPGTRAVDCQEGMCGPLRLNHLNQDLLLNIYSRAPRLAARHTRVCRYFWRTLASTSRIHVELSAQTPNRLTSGLLRFVQNSSQQLALALSDSTALKTLHAVLANEKARASVRHLGLCVCVCVCV